MHYSIYSHSTEADSYAWHCYTMTSVDTLKYSISEEEATYSMKS